MIKGADCIYYGGDYSPDQYSIETVKKDIEAFKKAGINIVTMPVFSWTKLEPEEGVYNFEWLDEVMDLFRDNDIYVCLATPTAAQPAWLSEKYPEVLPVDIAGRKRTHGMRVFYCVNSEKYRERCAAIAEEMAKRYANYPNLAMWHVSNEYGTYCYCENCRKKFQGWLKGKYGTIDNLNKQWNNVFWNKTYTDFSEVSVPNETNDEYRFNPTLNLEYMRFITDSTIECYENEAQILKKYNPNVTVQTNISGHIEHLDQFKMTKHTDIVSWDNYPKPTDAPAFVALKHDLMRGLRGGESFMMQEQSPNQQNWQSVSKLKRPGEVRMLSYQALAHGADACLFFQLRQSVSGQEMFHGAVISHADRLDTRIFNEVTQIGQELKKLGNSILDARTESKVGIIFDWDSWWAIEKASVNCLPQKKFNYVKKLNNYYKVFHRNNIPVDFISTEADFSKYDVILAPYLYIVDEDTANRLSEFTKSGKTLVGTTLTGICDKQSKAVYGAYPGLLRDVFGIWVEEIDPLYDAENNEICFNNGSIYKSGFQCDLYHNTTAKTLATYGKDFYKDMPVVSVNEYGAGKAYYIGTEPEADGIEALFTEILNEKNIKPYYEASKGVEVTRRKNAENDVLFVLNWNKEESYINLKDDRYENMVEGEEVSGMLSLKPYDAIVLKKIN